MKAQNVTESSKRKCCEPYWVQKLVLYPLVFAYRREHWQTPSDKNIVAPLPEHVRGHFGIDLRRLVLALYHHGQSSVKRISTLLQDWDVTTAHQLLALARTSVQSAEHT